MSFGGKGMKSLGLGAVLALGSSFALADPIDLPSGEGLVIQFENREQVDPTVGEGTDIQLGGMDTGENAWGVLLINTIRIADPATVDQSPPFLAQAGLDPVFGAGSFSNGQISGMFHGLQETTAPSGFDIASTDGFLDLYWDEEGLVGGGTLAQLSQGPGDRTGTDTFTNFTDGILLARLFFDSGINSGDSDVTLQGSFGVSPPDNAQGEAEGFLSVLDTNGDGVIDSSDGVWAPLLDTDFFVTAFGNRDIHFSNNFTRDTAWDPPTAPTTADDVFGADSSDPASAVVVPEPATVALLGLGLLGIAVTAGRVQKRRRTR